MQHYRPFDPKVGDVIYKGKSCTIDVSKPQLLSENVGIISAIRKPNHGSLLNYELAITKPNGTIETGQSQEWCCYRQLTAATKQYVIEQDKIIGILLAKLQQNKNVTTDNPDVEDIDIS